MPKCLELSPCDLSRCLALPTDASLKVRRKFGLHADERPRLAYLGGPGDVVGTFNYWSAGRFDPRVPVVAYSTMFFELVKVVDAEALVLTEVGGQPVRGDLQFQFSVTPRPKVSGAFHYWLAGLGFAWDSMRQLRSFRPHAVIVGSYSPPVLMALLPRSVRILLTAHNTYWPMGRAAKGLANRAKLALVGTWLKRISGGVCTSIECRRQIGTLRGSQAGLFVEVPQVLASNASTIRDSAEVRRLLYLGRMEADKGIFDLLSAFESLAGENSQVRLDFAGSGSAQRLLLTQIEASKYRARIRFLGQLTAKEVHETLAETDLLVCPTRSDFNEGLALVVVEAAVHGVPTLLSSVVPAKEAVAGACLEFPADDVDSLRACLKQVLEDPGAFRSLRARVAEKRAMFGDPAQSWGTHMYQALVA